MGILIGISAYQSAIEWLIQNLENSKRYICLAISKIFEQWRNYSLILSTIYNNTHFFIYNVVIVFPSACISDILNDIIHLLQCNSRPLGGTRTLLTASDIIHKECVCVFCVSHYVCAVTCDCMGACPNVCFHDYCYELKVPWTD